MSKLDDDLDQSIQSIESYDNLRVKIIHYHRKVKPRWVESWKIWKIITKIWLRNDLYISSYYLYLVFSNPIQQFIYSKSIVLVHWLIKLIQEVHTHNFN